RRILTHRLPLRHFSEPSRPGSKNNSKVSDRFLGRLAHWLVKPLMKRVKQKTTKHTQSRRSQEKFGCALAAARFGDARTVNPYKLRRGHSVHSPFRCYCGRARPGRSRLWRVPGNQLSIASHG